MSRSPFFSVVIPTYNSEKLLKKALRSVMNQTYSDFEIIIVDNFSKDSTKKIVKSFSDNRIRFVEINNNGVIALSRNKGIELSNGEWIAFLDSDDIWLSKKLEEVKDVIINHHSAIGVCHNEWLVINGKRKSKLIYGPTKNNNLYAHLLFERNCMSTSAVCIKKNIAVKAKGFSTRNDFVTAEDYEFWIRLSKEGEIFFIDNVLGEWHKHGENYSDNVDLRVKASISVVRHHLNLHYEVGNKFYNKSKKRLSRVYAGASRSYQLEGRFKVANHYAFKSIRNNFFQFKAWIILFFSLLRISRI